MSAAFMQKYMIDNSLSSNMTRRRQTRMTERKRSHLNLAQRVGLLEKPAPKLTEEEWKGLRKTAVDRGSHLRPCPICCDHFGTQPQVILSCSHVFHSACLKSFEKFSGNVVCPICRAKDYQAKLIDDGARIFKQRSIVVIQSWFRGYIARKKYFELLDKFPPSHPLVKRQHLIRKLKQTTKQMVKQVDKKQDALDLLFAQMESNLQLSKMAMEAAEIRGTLLAPDQWSSASVEWQKRDESDCPICMSNLRSKKKCTLLSCSHLFHEKCLLNFENFQINVSKKSPVCPICRGTYLRRAVKVKAKCVIQFIDETPSIREQHAINNRV